MIRVTNRIIAILAFIQVTEKPCLGVLEDILQSDASDSTGGESESKLVSGVDGYTIPHIFGGPMSDYPNPLNISEEIRRKFHPVVKFPHRWVKLNTEDQNGIYRTRWTRVPKYSIIDHTKSSGDDEIIPPHQQKDFRKNRRKVGLYSLLFRAGGNIYSVGKYDENRANLYSSDHYKNTSNLIDGYDGARTVHMGIDLGGPVGTKVYSFWDGVIHSVGYNEALGDYGFVIVVQYNIPLTDISKLLHSEAKCSTDKNRAETETSECQYSSGNKIHEGIHEKKNVFWALYGHLDSRSVSQKKNQRVKRGQILGRMGDVHENGGWSNPHVHFQLSILEPETHDMPGVVNVIDRERALINYPDPRTVLGPLY